jgi:hypothetical protein
VSTLSDLIEAAEAVLEEFEEEDSDYAEYGTLVYIPVTKEHSWGLLPERTQERLGNLRDVVTQAFSLLEEEGDEEFSEEEE